MTQLRLDLGAPPPPGTRAGPTVEALSTLPRSAPPAPPRTPPPGRAPPDGDPRTCVLVRELELIAASGRSRRRLVARTRGEGKELLRQLALRGCSWVGFEVTTVRPLAVNIAAERLAQAGRTVIDAFDEQALIERSIDAALRESSSPYADLAEKVGFRAAVRNSVEALRLGSVLAVDLSHPAARQSARRRLLAAALANFEALLDETGAADTALVLAAAARALAAAPAAAADPMTPTFLVPGLADRGLAGRFLRSLRRRGAVLLRTDPVAGLPAPKGMMWNAAPPESPGSFLHAVERLPPPRAPSSVPPSGSPRLLSIELFAAGSVYDELRGVLRRAIEMGARWDEVEIVAADPALYGSALHALADSLDVPVTFAVGLPVERTRPGRIVAAYFRWIESGFQESVFRALVEAGDICPPPPRAEIRGPRLARALRRLRIGWGRERHMERIRRELRRVRDLPAATRDDEQAALARRRADAAGELTALRALLGGVLDRTPDVDKPASPAMVAAGVKSLLDRAAAGTDTDDTARDRLRRVLDRIEATLDRATDFPAAAAIVKSLTAIRIPAPRTEGTAPWSSAAGHLYLSDLQHGGATGRPFTFIVGLDSGRFPGADHEDPLLLDRERRSIGGGELPFASERPADRRFGLAQLVARLRGTLVLSCARWDPAEARAVSPAPELLQALRLREGDPSLSFDDLDGHLGASESRLPRSEVRTDLDAADVWLRTLDAGDGRLRDGLRAVGRAHPLLGRGMAAARALDADAPSAHAGILGAFDAPLSYQDLSRRPLSASSLETLGTCPRRFLFREVLRAWAPDDPEFDPHRWLNAMQRGNLLHNVYARTLREARDRELDPDDDLFLAIALRAAAGEIEKAREETPAPSEVVRRIEIKALREDARSFVEMIRLERPPWMEVEMSFGGDEAAARIEAGPLAKPVLVRGRADRVDDLGSRARVIDYKTGTDYSYDSRTGVYNGGRRLQHAVYTAAVAKTLGRPVDRMEYHFATRRGENRKHGFDADKLRHGGALMAAMIAGAEAGLFPATDNIDDCKFCDYRDLCGVRESRLEGASCRFADWTARNLHDLQELSVLKLVRNWEDEEPLA